MMYTCTLADPVKGPCVMSRRSVATVGCVCTADVIITLAGACSFHLHLAGCGRNASCFTPCHSVPLDRCPSPPFLGTHQNRNTITRTHARTHACTHTHSHTHSHLHTHARTYTHAHTYTHIHTHTHTHARTYTHTHIHTHTHTHAHTHTHTHTHTRSTQTYV